LGKWTIGLNAKTIYAPVVLRLFLLTADLKTHVNMYFPTF
jgi:hypothetical protein